MDPLDHFPWVLGPMPSAPPAMPEPSPNEDLHQLQQVGRVKVDLSDFYQDGRYCYKPIDHIKTPTVGHLVNEMRKRFTQVPRQVDIKVDGIYVLPGDDIRVLKDGDVMRVTARETAKKVPEIQDRQVDLARECSIGMPFAIITCVAIFAFITALEYQKANK